MTTAIQIIAGLIVIVGGSYIAYKVMAAALDESDERHDD